MKIISSLLVSFFTVVCFSTNSIASSSSKDKNSNQEISYEDQSEPKASFFQRVFGCKPKLDNECKKLILDSVTLLEQDLRFKRPKTELLDQLESNDFFSELQSNETPMFENFEEMINFRACIIKAEKSGSLKIHENQYDFSSFAKSQSDHTKPQQLGSDAAVYAHLPMHLGIYPLMDYGRIRISL